MTAKAPAKGHPAKHATPSKAQAKAKPPPKHAPAKQKKPAAAQAKGTAVHTAAKPAKPAKPAGFAIGDLLPVCAFEALAQSLRLAGQLVDDDEVAWLWELCGSHEVSIETALTAAARFGLAGCRPFAVHLPDEPSLPFGQRLHAEGVDLGEVDHGIGGGVVHSLILGVDRPGYHAVLATPDGWWSWGALYSPWDARVEEAWGVSWG